MENASIAHRPAHRRVYCRKQPEIERLIVAAIDPEREPVTYPLAEARTLIFTSGSVSSFRSR